MAIKEAQEVLDTRTYPGGYDTEELKTIVGDFENKYKNACVGDKITNNILGYTYRGIIDFALQFGAIGCQKLPNKERWFVKYPRINEWIRQEKAIIEIKIRRETAKKFEQQELNEIYEYKDMQNMSQEIQGEKQYPPINLQ